jgi:hypothetical protein
MRTRATLLSLASLLALIGCRPPPEPPGEVGELARYLFAQFDVQRQDELVAGVQALEGLLEGVDLESEDPDDRSWTIAVLSDDFLGAVEPTPGADANDQVPVGLAGLYHGDFGDRLELLLDPNQVCITTGSYVYYERSFDGDTACFEDGGCERVEATDEARYESVIMELWTLSSFQARRLTLEDGRPALVWRSWLADYEADSDNMFMDQRYTVDAAFPTGDGDELVRYSGLSDATMESLLRYGLQEAIDNENAFTAGEACENDRNQDYSSPF